MKMGWRGKRCSTLPWPKSTRKPRPGAPGQLAADARVIMLVRRRLQVKLGQRDFAILARPEVIERLAHYRVILNLRLMTILENQHGLRLVGWSFDWFRCRRRLSRFLILPRTVSIILPRT